MKHLLISLFAVCWAMGAAAQNDQLTATLQHGNDVSVFTGATALQQAHEAAVDGDVITLSDGQFQSTDLTKSISLYGAGYEAKEGNPTTINGDMKWGADATTLNKLHIEGIYFTNSPSCNTTATINELSITGCYFANTYFNVELKCDLGNVTISGCVFQRDFAGDPNKSLGSLFVTHSWVNGRVINFPTGVLISNCILNGYYNMNTTECKNSAFTYKNSIFTNTQTGYWTNFFLGDNSKVSNSLFVTDYHIGQYADATNNYIVGLADIFTDAENAEYTADRTFELKQPETWLGDDGTQVGLHGGSGWQKEPAIPVVKSLQLTVEDSKLKVTYDAEAR